MQNQTQSISSTDRTDFQIRYNVGLADKNWFGTGGPARYYCEPSSSNELQKALMYRRQNNLELFMLGSGANILISDKGFNGLVIKPSLKNISICDDTINHGFVTAEAGVDFPTLIQFCLNNNLLGLEEFSGIPGTVGGSVFINIHYFQFLLSDFIEYAHVIERSTGSIMKVDYSWFEFGYNTSKLQTHEYFLVDATFKLKKATDLETAYARGRNQEIIRHRKQRYPYSGTCGSFFRNFHNHEVTLTTAEGKKLIFVAYYLDMLGIKGSLSCNDAVVSHQHANMIVNKGTATSDDIIQLARTMQTIVLKKFNLLPQPECQLIGFDTYPLLGPYVQ